MIWILSITAVLCNVSAQICIKLANQPGRSVMKGWETWISPWLTPWIVAALLLYGASFVLTVRIFALLPLSIAAPAMAGATFFLVALASTFLLGEHLSYLNISGIVCLVR